MIPTGINNNARWKATARLRYSRSTLSPGFTGVSTVPAASQPKIAVLSWNQWYASLLAS